MSDEGNEKNALLVGRAVSVMCIAAAHAFLCRDILLVIFWFHTGISYLTLENKEIVLAIFRREADIVFEKYMKKYKYHLDLEKILSDQY